MQDEKHSKIHRIGQKPKQNQHIRMRRFIQVTCCQHHQNN
jgi:hypothetical protein